MAKLKLGVDVGGTFTDVVGINEDGKVYFAKTPSTPEDQSIGVLNGIRALKKNDPMELVSLRLSVVGEMDKSNLYSKGEISKELPKPEEIRKAYFMGEWLDTAVYKRDALKAGNSFIGPAIIEETGATSVVGPGDKVTVDERMNLVVKIANHETGKMEALEEN